MARYALVIGIAKYKDRRLSALSKALTDKGSIAPSPAQTHGENTTIAPQDSNDEL